MSHASLAVHPFGGYLAAWGVVSVVVGEWCRRRGGAAGWAAMVAATVFLVGGGAIEWLREPLTVVRIGEMISAYPFLYWIGAVATAGLGLWFQREN